jgi:Methyltransferase domain
MREKLLSPQTTAIPSKAPGLWTDDGKGDTLNAMKTIKPRDIFNLLPPAPVRARLVKLPMPQAPFGLGMHQIEILCVIAMGQHLKATRFFEFGTGDGATTAALALNFPAAKIVTIDIADQPGAHENTRFDNVARLLMDSTEYHPLEGTCRSYDLILVDGGHEPRPFISDTALAAQMVRPGGAIFWHDCGNPQFPHIEEFLESYATRIEGTMLAFTAPI